MFVLWCLICCMLSVKDKTLVPQSIHWRGHISVWKCNWTNTLAAQLNNLLQLARTLILPGYLGVCSFFPFLVCCFSLWSMQEGDRIIPFQTVSSMWDCHDGWACVQDKCTVQMHSQRKWKHQHHLSPFFQTEGVMPADLSSFGWVTSIICSHHVVFLHYFLPPNSSSCSYLVCCCSPVSYSTMHSIQAT